MSGEEGFLARWSRRKRAVVAEPDTDPTPGQAPDSLPGAAPTEPGAAPEPAPAAAAPGCPIPNLPEIDLASLPKIEELTAESDFSLFLRPGIPQGLRNAALRRMWSLDPAIRDYIGPVDYQWDFNTPGGLPFGFSNELVGDIGKLLAQAIGQLPDEPKEKAPPVDGPETAAAEDLPMVEAPAPVPAEMPPPDPVRLAAIEPEAPAPEPAPEPLPVPRRRHGGALPS